MQITQRTNRLMLVLSQIRIFTATDHVGRSTTATSPGVTIDSTPPSVSKVPIDVANSYITERRELSPTWSGVFDDAESGELAIF